MKKYVSRLTAMLCLVFFLMSFVSCAFFDLLTDTGRETAAETLPETSSPATEPATEPETISPTTEPATEPETLSPATEPETLPETPAPETEPELSSVEKRIASMTLEEKVGQLFIMSTTDNAAENRRLIEKIKPGAIVMFASFFENRTVSSSAEEIASLQAVGKTPMFVCVDEEGGTVTRVSRFPQYRSSKFLSPRELLAAGGTNRVTLDTEERCLLLSSVGVNMNFAPVCDISTSENEFIYWRSAGNTDAAVSYVSAYIKECNRVAFGTCLKHFPGYGGNVDTHVGVAVDSRDYQAFVNSDFLPFKAGIDAGADMVMVSHNIVKCMDPDHPSSLSAEVHRILREELGFRGVIVPDALGMDAIRTQYGEGESAVLCVQCGNDMVTASDLETQYDAVLNAVKSGRITEERLNESVLRILNLKNKLGILD